MVDWPVAPMAVRGTVWGQRRGQLEGSDGSVSWRRGGRVTPVTAGGGGPRVLGLGGPGNTAKGVPGQRSLRGSLPPAATQRFPALPRPPDCGMTPKPVFAWEACGLSRAADPGGPSRAASTGRSPGCFSGPSPGRSAVGGPPLPPSSLSRSLDALGRARLWTGSFVAPWLGAACARVSGASLRKSGGQWTHWPEDPPPGRLCGGGTLSGMPAGLQRALETDGGQWCPQSGHWVGCVRPRPVRASPTGGASGRRGFFPPPLPRPKRFQRGGKKHGDGAVGCSFIRARPSVPAAGAGGRR